MLGGAGSARTLTLIPVAAQSGTANITVSVTDGTATGSGSFVVTVRPVNQPPTLDPIPDLLLRQDAPPQGLYAYGPWIYEGSS